MLAVTLTLVCWAVSSPPGSSPDDTFHMNSIWCSRGDDNGRCRPGGDAATRLLPHQVAIPQCFVGVGTRSAACRPDGYDQAMQPDTRTKAGNWNSGYPPVYYAAMSVFVLDTLDRSVVAMRVANSLLAVVVVAALTWLLPRRLKPVRAPLAFLVTSVPLSLFTLSSLNPSGWAILSGGTLWLAVYGAYEVTGRRQAALLGVGLLAMLLGAGARSDAGLFAIVGVLLALGLRGGLLRREWRATLAAAGLVLVAGFLFVTSGHASVALDGMPGHPPATVSGLSLLVANALQVPFLWTSTLGVGPMATMGWLDTPVPTLVGVGSLLPCCVVLFQGWGWMWWQKAVAIALTLGALTAYPLILGQKSHVLVGYPIQPRYLIPLLVMLAGISLLPAADEQLRFTRGRVVVLVAAMSAAQSISLYYNIWRYTKGLQRPYEFSAETAGGGAGRSPLRRPCGSWGRWPSLSWRACCWPRLGSGGSRARVTLKVCE